MLEEDILNQWCKIISKSKEGKVDYNYVESVFQAFPSEILQLAPRDGSHYIIYGQNIFLVRDSEGNNLLHLAAKANNPSLIYFLLSHGVDAEERNSEGKDFQSIYLDSPPQKTPREVSKFLKTCTEKQESAPQILFANSLSTEILPKFIRKFCIDYKERDPSIVFSATTPAASINEQGDTLLHVCARNNLDLFLEGLTQAILDINTVTNHKGVTPLMIAAQFNNYNAADILLRSGANPNARDELGQSALIKAIDYKAIEVIEAILRDERTDLQITDNSGRTAGDEAKISSPRVRDAYLIAMGERVESASSSPQVSREAEFDNTMSYQQDEASSSRGVNFPQEIIASAEKAVSRIASEGNLSSMEPTNASDSTWMSRAPLKARKTKYAEYFDLENEKIKLGQERNSKSLRK